MFFDSTATQAFKKLAALRDKNARNQDVLMQRSAYEAEAYSANGIMALYYQYQIEQLNADFFQFKAGGLSLNESTNALESLHALLECRNNETLAAILQEDKYDALLKAFINSPEKQESQYIIALMKQLFADERVISELSDIANASNRYGSLLVATDVKGTYSDIFSYGQILSYTAILLGQFALIPFAISMTLAVTGLVLSGLSLYIKDSVDSALDTARATKKAEGYLKSGRFFDGMEEESGPSQALQQTSPDEEPEHLGGVAVPA